MTYDAGRFALYGHTGAAALWASNTYMHGAQPYTFTMQQVRGWRHACSLCRQPQTRHVLRTTRPSSGFFSGCQCVPQSCNAVLTDGSGAVQFSTNTGSAGAATPCQLQMRTDSTFAIVDANSKVVASFGTPQTNGNQAVALLNSGRFLYQARPVIHPCMSHKLLHCMHAHHGCSACNVVQLTLLLVLQGYELFSADFSTFLIAQPDGNLVLYNTALANVNGRTSAAALYGSGSYNPNPVNPYYLTMQTVSFFPAKSDNGVHANLKSTATAGRAPNQVAQPVHFFLRVPCNGSCCCCRIATLSCTTAIITRCMPLAPTVGQAGRQTQCCHAEWWSTQAASAS